MQCLSWRHTAHYLLLALASSIAQAAAPVPQAATSPVHAVTGVADGQAGYVHYFLIIHPDGTPEEQVGIELEDRRIAWSFPGAGVIVSDFMRYGMLSVSGSMFKIEHLHGIRPFRDARDMQVLRKDLAQRVAYWIDEETPYCIFRQPGEQLCLNCGDFVARILFPATNALMVGLPEELTRAVGSTPSTDDLLIYMLGLHTLPDARSRLNQLGKLNLPDSLRLDVVSMLQQGDTTNASPGKKPSSRLARNRPQNRRL